jgi:uncharacterized protein HemY
VSWPRCRRAFCARAELARYRGDVDEAERLMREWLSHTTKFGFDPNSADLARLVDILISQGRDDDAARALDDLGRPLSGLPRRRIQRAVRRARLARLDGRQDDVPGLLADLVDEHDLPPEQAIRYVESAYAALHRADTSTASDLLDELDRRAGDVGLVLLPQERAFIDDVRHRVATSGSEAGRTLNR